MITYLYFREKLIDENGERVCFGIKAYKNGVCVKTISDISHDEEQVSRLAKAFTENRLALSHMEQCVEEYLYDFSL